jgi:hypothetical protein
VAGLFEGAGVSGVTASKKMRRYQDSDEWRRCRDQALAEMRDDKGAGWLGRALARAEELYRQTRKKKAA